MTAAAETLTPGTPVWSRELQPGIVLRRLGPRRIRRGRRGAQQARRADGPQGVTCLRVRRLRQPHPEGHAPRVQGTGVALLRGVRDRRRAREHLPDRRHNHGQQRRRMPPELTSDDPALTTPRCPPPGGALKWPD